MAERRKKMTNITLHPDKEENINLVVRSFKNNDDTKTYVLEINVNGTNVIIYSDDITKFVKMSNKFDSEILDAIKNI